MKFRLELGLPAALIAGLLLTGSHPAHAGDAKVFSGSQCQPNEYASESYIVRRGIAAVNLDSNLNHPTRWVVCPIIRDRVETVSSWPGVVVRVHTSHAFDPRPLSCYLYGLDRWGNFHTFVGYFTHSRNGFGTYVIEGKARDGHGYDALVCGLPYQAELRAYTVTE